MCRQPGQIEYVVAITRPGEVFYQHTRKDPVGSPVAVKLGLRTTKGGASNA